MLFVTMCLQGSEEVARGFAWLQHNVQLISSTKHYRRVDLGNRSNTHTDSLNAKVNVVNNVVFMVR